MAETWGLIVPVSTSLASSIRTMSIGGVVAIIPWTSTMAGSQLLRRRLDCRNQHAASLQDTPGALLGVPADRVKDDVGIVHDILEWGGCVVDDLVDAQLWKKSILRDAVPMTFAPRHFANWTAMCPTPPAAA